MPARKDLDQHLDQQQLLDVYAIISSEPLLVNAAVRRLRERAVTAAPDFNQDSFRAGEVEIQRVLEAASTLPMMAPTRWVHLKDIHKLKSPEQEALLAYLDAPSTRTVFCLSGEKLNQNSKLGRRLSRANALFVIEPPKQRQLGHWIQKRAKTKGYLIETPAAELLAALIGTDLGSLDMALDKVALYAGDAAAIASEHVEECVAPTRMHSIFELTDAVGERNVAKATLRLRNALAHGQSGLMVLAMLARQFRNLATVKSLAGQGVQGGELARRAGVPAFLAEPLRKQAAQYTHSELRAALSAAAAADVRLKASRLDAEVVLARMLINVMQPQSQMQP